MSSIDCVPIPFIADRLYCYGPLFLDFWDKAFFVTITAILLATLVGYIQGVIK